MGKKKHFSLHFVLYMVTARQLSSKKIKYVSIEEKSIQVLTRDLKKKTFSGRIIWE